MEGGIAIDDAPVAPRTRRLPRIFTEPMWVLGLVILMDETDKNIVRGLIPQLKAEFHVGDLAIGVLLSLALLFNGIITVPAGYLADRWNRSRAIGRTVIGWSALSAAGAASVGFPMLVGFRSALGFGQAVTEPSAASLIGDYYPPVQRGKAFSIQQVMLLAGTGVGVGLGGLIGTTLGWRPALVIVAIPGLLVSILVFRLREPKRGTADLMAAIGGGEIEHHEGDHVDLFEHGFAQFVRDMWDGLKADMRTILNIRTMRYALVGVAALLFTVTAIAAWLPQFYERQLHAPEGRGEGIFFLIVVLGGIPGVLLGGRIADRYAPKLTGGRLALPAIFLFIGTGFFCVSYVIHADEYTMSAIIPCFLLELVGLHRDVGDPRFARWAHRRDPRAPTRHWLRRVQPRVGRVRHGRRAVHRRCAVVGVRRQPPRRVPHRVAVLVHRRAGAVSRAPLPRRGHAEDHDGGFDGVAGGARSDRRRRRKGWSGGRNAFVTGCPLLSAEVAG